MTLESMIIGRIQNPVMYALGGGTYATAYIVGRALRAYGSSRPTEHSYPSIVKAIQGHDELKGKAIPSLKEILFFFDEQMTPMSAKEIRSRHEISRLWKIDGREAVEKYYDSDAV